MFELEVAGEMKLARMERRRGTGEWVTAQGYELRDGMRAGFDRRERYARREG